MEALIQQSKTIICVGSGGVGKTTISAAIGYLAAESGKKVLVLTIDPARRLAQAMGIGSSGAKREPSEVKKFSSGGVLYADSVDAEAAFLEFIKDSYRETSAMQKLADNPLFKQLSTALSGSQEFTSLDRLYRSVKSEKYDLVILDTPPAQNAIEFFLAPEKIYNLFQRSITKWFAGTSDKNPFYVNLLNAGTKTVLAALERITGSQFISALADFFKSVEGLQEKISARSLSVHQLLKSTDTHFVLVSSFDEIKLREAKSLYTELLKFGYQFNYMVVNKYCPEWIQVAGSHLVPLQNQQLNEYHAKMLKFYKNQDINFAQIHAEIEKEMKVVKIPEIDQDIGGLEEIRKLADRLRH